jgi:hypothetical protein
VILPPTARAPPTVGVKENVAAEPVLPATRLLVAIENNVFNTRSPIAPDPIPELSAKSALVENMIPLLLPAETTPRMSPFKVICTDDDAEIAAVAVVITIAVADGAAEVPVDAPLIVTFGIAAILKKPEGYVNVTKLPTASPPPTVVVKLNVADTFVLPATRSAPAITNDPGVTCPPMTPDAIPKEGVTSALVETTMPPLLPPFATPMVSPKSVTVTALLATSAPLLTVNTIDVEVNGREET